MTKTLLSSTAVLIFALSAAAAYAQDSDMAEPDPTHDKAVMEAAEDGIEATDNEMEVTEDLAEDAIDPELDMKDTDMETDTFMIEADTVTSDEATSEPMAEDTVTLDCPEGTEAHPDGTCRVVDDWDAVDEPDE